MELNVGFMELLRLGGSLVQHKLLQIRLATDETVIRNTNKGQVKGLKRKTVYGEDSFYYAFEGIPYAQPPLGDLRFRAPQPAQPWEGVRDCTKCAAKPLQQHFVLRVTEGSEDCLYLNVYAKKLQSDKPLPVMVWIHGGGFQVGEASRDIYAPDYFMQQDVIFVAVAYRLGMLGFLSLQDPDLQIPGNAGLKDQLMALQWIKANIANFNGDANNITLFGESAGAASAHFMMIANKAKGLFHKAILQSGSVLCPWTYTPQQDWCYRAAQMIGYKGSNNEKQLYAFLSKVDAKKLLAHDGNLLTIDDRWKDIIVCFGPVVEPYECENSLITKPYKDLLKNAWSNDIPLIIGGTSFEGLFFYVVTKKFPHLLNELGDFEKALPLEIRSKYFDSDPNLKEMGLRLKKKFLGELEAHVDSAFFEYLDLQSYKFMWHGLLRTLRARLNYAPTTPTYLYRFDFDSEYFNHYRILKCGRRVRGVAHADDISYLFYTIASAKLAENTLEYKTIQRMIGMWTSFAANSNPNGQHMDNVNWEPVADVGQMEDGPKCLNIGNDLQYVQFPQYHKAQLFDSYYERDDLI